MTAVGQLIRKLREEQGLTTRELAKKLTAMGFPTTHATVANKERGGSAVTHQDRKQYAQALGLSVDDFDSRWRGSRIERTDGDETGRRGIPVINRAPAGMVVDYEEYGVDSGQGHEYIERGTVDDDLAFAVIVVGDSMEPALFAGDYIVFSPLNVPRPRTTLDAGKVAFIRFSNDSKKRGCCIARFVSMDGAGKLKFSKDNPKHKGFSVDREEIQQLAVGVEKRSRKL